VNIFKRFRIRHILHRYPVPRDLWRQAVKTLPVAQGLSAVEKAHLRELATLFLRDKKFAGVQGLQLTDAMCLTIAVLACLPVLGLGFGCLSGWTEVIVYPGAFRIAREEPDDAGVVHFAELELDGESWSRGPLILSWQAIEQDLEDSRSGRNVVIHEVAHKLDVLNGPADGYPPLHRFMDLKQWTLTLATAYRTLARQVERRHYPALDPYAAASPAEFFAVVSEYFFCAPDILDTHFPEVYRQLQLYYRQHPLPRYRSEKDKLQSNGAMDKC
jgi:Mlc titration factor MtfA (ptsG expression regulator)